MTAATPLSAEELDSLHSSLLAYFMPGRDTCLRIVATIRDDREEIARLRRAFGRLKEVDSLGQPDALVWLHRFVDEALQQEPRS